MNKIMMASDVLGNFTTRLEPVPKQSSPNHTLLMAVIGILSFFCVIGVVGNALVLYVYVKKRNKLASTVFIITLACTDFITCVLIIPYTIVLEYMVYKIKYDAICKFYMFLITSNVPFSAFIMMAIAVDRYLCICHPFTHILNTKRAKIIISILAAVSFVLGVITALNFGVYYTGIESVPRRDMSVLDNDNDTYYVISMYDNDKSKINTSEGLRYDGLCQPNGLIFSHTFTATYQKVYSSFFVIVIAVVVVLYIMIYRFVSLQRARRRRMRKYNSGYSTCKKATNGYINTRASLTNGCVKTELETESVTQNSPRNEKTDISSQLTIREKGLIANVRTAGMLFVVTAVFIIVFLPAWLMAHNVIPYNILVFYMYFFYNVANPIIYAFMNKAFRRDLKDVVECRFI